MNRLAAIALALLAPVAALAEELDEHHPHPGIPWGKLALSVINFALFIYILRRTLWPTLRNWITERHLAVRAALEQAERARRDAEALRVEWQRRMDTLAGELEAMLQQARADSTVERDHILAAARATAEAITRDAERTAENELRQAREQLRAELAAAALAIAERRAPERLGAAEHARFVDEFVAEVSR